MTTRSLPTRPEPQPAHPVLEQPTEPLWTVEEVAQYLRLEPDTVRAMARDVKLPAIKVGRMWRFKRSALQKYLNEQGLSET